MTDSPEDQARASLDEREAALTARVERYATLCNLFERAFARHFSTDMNDDFPPMTSPEARQFANKVEELFGVPELDDDELSILYTPEGWANLLAHRRNQ